VFVDSFVSVPWAVAPVKEIYIFSLSCPVLKKESMSVAPQLAAAEEIATELRLAAASEDAAVA